MAHTLQHTEYTFSGLMRVGTLDTQKKEKKELRHNNRATVKKFLFPFFLIIIILFLSFAAAYLRL